MIVMEDVVQAWVFMEEVDCVVVYYNVFICFIDGGQLGMGVEIVISIQKFYVRGLISVG